MPPLPADSSRPAITNSVDDQTETNNPLCGLLGGGIGLRISR